MPRFRAIVEQIEHKPMRRCRHTQIRLTRDLSQVCNAAEHDCLRSVPTETKVDDDVNVECSQSIFNYEKAASYQLRYDAALCVYVSTDANPPSRVESPVEHDCLKFVGRIFDIKIDVLQPTVWFDVEIRILLKNWGFTTGTGRKVKLLDSNREGRLFVDVHPSHVELHALMLLVVRAFENSAFDVANFGIREVSDFDTWNV